MIPVVLGLDGTELTEREVAFIRTYQPMAFLLFARNIVSIEQTRKLTSRLKQLAPHALIGVDQEGGRVQRLTFHGRYPAAIHYGNWYKANPAQALEALRIHGFLLAADLAEVGADWVFAPVLDKLYPDTHEMIGSRTLGDDTDAIIELARAELDGIAAGGCHACLKHAPGQGRASLDTHQELPRVTQTKEELEGDFLPFRTLARDVPFIMTSHVCFTAFGDKATTLNPATLGMIRDEWQSGLIMADDLGMEALKGTYVSRFFASIEAGCDAAICSFSRLKAGMAGTIYAQDDAALFFEAANDFPQVSDRVKERMALLPVLEAPTSAQVEEMRAKFAALWADVPKEVGYTWPA